MEVGGVPIRNALDLDITLTRLIEQLNEGRDLERGDQIITALLQAGLMHRIGWDTPGQRYILLSENGER